MIRRLVAYFIILVAAMLLGWMISVDPGYVLLSYAHWTVEMPLWFAVVVLVLIWLVLHFGRSLWGKTTHLGRSMTGWRNKRRVEKAQTLTERGVMALIQSNWTQMEKYLSRGARVNHLAWINYLGAAFAAQKQGHHTQQIEYIRQAYACAPDEKLVIGLMQAQLQIEQQQFELALATLKHLRQLAPRHPLVLRLLQILYVKLQDWLALKQLLPQLKKILSQVERLDLQVMLYTKLLAVASDEATWRALWQEVPHALRVNAALLSIYVPKLMHEQLDEEAIPLVERALSHQWDSQLIDLYGQLKVKHPEKQLKFAEAWLKNRRRDPILLLSLARMAMRFKHWGKAKEYCLASLQVQPSPEAYALLAHLHEESGDKVRAIDIYRKMAKLVAGA